MEQNKEPEFVCIKQHKSHTGKFYRLEQIIPQKEWNTLSFSEKTENFKLNIRTKVEGIGNCVANELN